MVLHQHLIPKGRHFHKGSAIHGLLFIKDLGVELLLDVVHSLLMSESVLVLHQVLRRAALLFEHLYLWVKHNNNPWLGSRFMVLEQRRLELDEVVLCEELVGVSNH